MPGLLRWMCCGWLSLAMVGVAHAGTLEFKKDKADQLTYFDPAESAPAYHVLQVDPREGPAFTDTVFWLDAGKAPGAVLCVNVLEITGVSKGLFSSRRTVVYSHHLVNASRLRSIRELTPAEKQALGLEADESEDIGRLELQGGAQLTVLTPGQSRYAVCQVKGQQVTAKELVPTEHYQVNKKKTSEGKTSCWLSQPGQVPTLGRAYRATTYLSGPEAATRLQACQAHEAAWQVQLKEEAARKALALQEANAQYEVARSQHAMVPGVEILARLGADLAERLVRDCGRNRFLSQPEPISKEEERKRYCMGYYREEVEGLQREMRIRGLVRN